MPHLKRNIIEVKAVTNCLANTLIKGIAKVTNNPDYKAHRQGRKIRSLVQNLLETTGTDLTKGAVIPELERFQTHNREYKIVVYKGIDCDSISFVGQVESSQRLKLL